jgi:hypothetical protein
MHYHLTRANIGSISDPELAFSTDRLLPPLDEIPAEFKKGNIYTELAYAIFSNQDLPAAEMEFRPGFQDPEAPAALNRCVRAHLQSFAPKEQHKIAGVGYMISLVCEVKRT